MMMGFDSCINKKQNNFGGKMKKQISIFTIQNKYLILSMILILVSGSIWADGSELKYEIKTDVLGGSKISIAAPKEWNNKVLLLAHGLRDKTAPLSAEFDPENEFYENLLDEGWIIGSTSYSRNGVIIQDAISDIILLKKYIEDKFGIADEIYAQGRSMGGMICTLIAEQKETPFDGVLNIGAALGMKENNEPAGLSYAPQIPILYLSNENEIDRPENYIAQIKDQKFMPILWIVDRQGHCNVNGAEVSQAFNALQDFVHGEQIENAKHLLIDMMITNSNTEFIEEKALNKVMSINETYGNIFTAFSRDDLQKMGILQKESFIAGFQDNEFEVFYGTTYSDVPVGEWIAFITAEGTLQISRNFANAADELKCKADDIIFIKKK